MNVEDHFKIRREISLSVELQQAIDDGDIAQELLEKADQAGLSAGQVIVMKSWGIRTSDDLNKVLHNPTARVTLIQSTDLNAEKLDKLLQVCRVPNPRVA